MASKDVRMTGMEGSSMAMAMAMAMAACHVCKHLRLRANIHVGDHSYRRILRSSMASVHLPRCWPDGLLSRRRLDGSVFGWHARMRHLHWPSSCSLHPSSFILHTPLCVPLCSFCRRLPLHQTDVGRQINTVESTPTSTGAQNRLLLRN